MKNIKVAIIGHICIDHNISEKTSYIGPGGPAIFISKILNKFKDCKITIISPYGKDFSPYIENQTFLPLKPAANSTLVYEKVTKDGRRTQKALNRKNAIPVKIQGEINSVIKEADIIFITPLLSNFSIDYIKQISELVKEKAIKVLLPQGYFRNFDAKNKVIFRKFSQADKVLPFVDFSIVSDRDYPNIKRLSSAWAKKHNVVLIITLEDKGALIVNKDKKILVPTTPVAKNKIVDSIGCGDVFSAGFSYNYIKTRSLEKAVRFANKLARKHLLA